MWPPCRSTYSSAIATISIGNAATTISTLTSAVQVNTGIRSSDIPGARWRAIVTRMHAAISEHPDGGEDHAEHPQVLADARGVGAVRTAARRRTSRPGRRLGGQPARLHDQAAGEPDPEAGQRHRGAVSARPDLQRHEVHRQRDRHRRDEQVDHRRAVHREQLVVGVVRDNSWPVRLRELGAHQQREHAAEQEEHERQHPEVQPDPLVVGARERAEPAGRCAVRRRRLAVATLTGQAVAPLCAQAANCAGLTAWTGNTMSA